MIAPELAEIRAEAYTERVALEGADALEVDWDFAPADSPPETEEVEF